MKKITWICVVIISLAISVFGQFTAEKINVKGLKGEVRISRDSRGIPYIEAKNDADLYFAQGYVTASDRLWQMDLFRRISRGQLSEIFGKQVLDQDKHWRSYGFASLAEQGLLKVNPQLREALENYAKGVNAYIATLNDKTLPAEFKLLQYKPTPWKATDTICVGKILAEGLSSTWQNDLIRTSLQNLPKDKLSDLINLVTPYDVIMFGKDKAEMENLKTVLHSVKVDENDLKLAEKSAEIRKKSLEMAGFYAEDLAASNNWVISGKRTLDGKSILANDPHLQPSAPGIWYLTHLSTPTMRVAGVTFAGVPGIVLGHNDSIAWGATNVGPDVQDLYRETFNDKGEYKTPTGWAKPTIRKETIKVRKSLLTTQTEDETFDVLETRNGVMITDEVGQKFSLKWTARNPENQEFEAFYFLNRAKNWTDFQSSLKTYGGATQNFIYADVKGNIGWIAAGRIPIRKKGDGSVVFDGSTDEGDWIGYIPFNELPMLYNPPSGFIVTANQRIVGTDYKYQQLARDFASPWRAKRIYELIKNNPKITMDNVSDIQRDVQSFPHQKLAVDLLNNNAASGETLSDLRGWDGRMTANSRPALIVNEIRNCVANKIAEDNFPVPSFVIRERLMYRIIDEKPSRWLPSKFSSFNDLYKTCDTESRAKLTKDYGDQANWTWGKFFKSKYPHPLAIAPLIGDKFKIPEVGINGSGTTPNVGSNVSMRFVTSPQNWDETRHQIPLGQSGNPESSFWKDQWDAWNTGKPLIFPFTQKAVQNTALNVTIMQPIK
jgi:penicillin amidase